MLSYFRAAYWRAKYFAAGLFSGTAAAREHHPAPSCRLMRVGSEARRFTIHAEARQFTVPVEPRVFRAGCDRGEP
jgi:hypothetical protein